MTKKTHATFTFEARDEGLFVALDGRGVAHVDTKVVGENHDPKLKHPEKTVTAIPREEWKIHFTATRLTPGQLEAFLKELADQED